MMVAEGRLLKKHLGGECFLFPQKSRYSRKGRKTRARQKRRFDYVVHY